MNLEHKDHHSKFLNEYDIDVFSGDWITKSVGKCIDFNFIVKKDISADMSIVSEDFKKNSKKIFIFSFEENLDLVLKSKNKEYKIQLLKEDLLEVTNKDREELVVKFIDKDQLNKVIIISLDR